MFFQNNNRGKDKYMHHLQIYKRKQQNTLAFS